MRETRRTHGREVKIEAVRMVTDANRLDMRVRKLPDFGDSSVGM